MSESSATYAREREVQVAIRIEVFTVVWMVLEAAISIGAGIAAASLLLTAFGIDSLFELVSGAILLWRLTVEERGKGRERDAGSAEQVEQVERAERRAAWVVAIALALLCLYVLVSALYGFLTQSKPESAPVGIGIAVAAVIVMPWLGVTKRRLATRLQSSALRGDAVSSFTCGYMAASVLVGLVLNAWFHWWWAEDLAALVFLFWLARETLEAFKEARGDDAGMSAK